MTRLLHISDTHFGTTVEPVVKAVQRLVTEWQPDVVLLGGDITQRARRHQFALARTFVQSLGRPVLAVPGNHDMPLFNLFARVLNPYGNYRRALGATLEPVFDNDQVLAIGVNSTRPHRRKDGEVSAEQVQRVAQRLRGARRGQLRVVLMHHPVRAVEESDTANLLIGRERAVPAWVDAGVDLILGGHIHLPYVVPLFGSQGPQGRGAWAVQAGTATSWRVRGSVPNSINLIEYAGGEQADACMVERWDFDAATEAFARAAAHPLILHRPD